MWSTGGGNGNPIQYSWTAGRSDQSILKEINSEYSLEGLLAEAEAPVLWPHVAKC